MVKYTKRAHKIPCALLLLFSFSSQCCIVFDCQITQSLEGSGVLIVNCEGNIFGMSLRSGDAEGKVDIGILRRFCIVYLYSRYRYFC